MSIRDALHEGTTVILGIMALRGLPVLMVFFTAERTPLPHKVIALLAYQMVVFSAVTIASFDVVRVVTAYAYLVLVSALPYMLSDRAPRWLLFALCFAGFLVVPAWLLPAHWMIALLGWDIAMASYSFCVDAKAGARSPRRYMFFVFVNPTLAFPARGQRVASPQLSAPGLLRMSQGLAGLFLSGVASTLAAGLRATFDDVPAAAEVGSMSARIGSIYLAHTGLASLQIGMMRLVGYALPERYDRVLSVRSPVEFWTRWNTYVATWARLYVFMPVVRSLRKTLPNRARGFAHGAATVVTFVTIGVLHDLYSLAQLHTAARAITPWFAANGVLVIVWHWAEQRTRVRWRRDEVPLVFARTAAFAALVAVFATQLP